MTDSEALEDLTGGITQEILSSDILDKEKFWQELLEVNKNFLFGCSTGLASHWLYPPFYGEKRSGIVEGHAYSVMDAVEVKGERLLRLRYVDITHLPIYQLSRGPRPSIMYQQRLQESLEQVGMDWTVE